MGNIFSNFVGKVWDGFVAFLQGPKFEEPKDMRDAIAKMSRLSPF